MNPDNFSIRTKLALVVGLFLVPVSLLAWLFVQQSFKDINFAQKERDGIVYLRGTWPVLMSLIAASNDPKATPASHLAGDPKLDELKRFDAAMETEEAAKALTQSLAKIGCRGVRSSATRTPNRRSPPRGRCSQKLPMVRISRSIRTSIATT